VRRIYRYEVPVDDRPHTVQAGPPLRVEARDVSTVEFWAEDFDGFEPSRTFQVFGTGHDVPPTARWCGTTSRTPEGLVWHLFELEAQEG
jgi:hypothetical protein